ncbi:hypothetical protein ATER59S_00996 [Aquamicrobium terrae]
MSVFGLVFLVEMTVVLGAIAWQDYSRLKIPNELTLLTLGVVATFWTCGAIPIGWIDLIFAIALFVMSICFWLAGKVGAGDVKLLGVVALPVGIAGGMPFAISLCALALATAGGYRWMMMFGYRHPRLWRWAELAERKQVPYGVLISLATIIALLARFRS